MTTTDSQRVASLVLTHGINDLAQAVYDWLTCDPDNMVSVLGIMDAIRSYGDTAP